ncbi:nucleotide-binding protein [Mesorhizobium sp.]|uniref:nucleotide-binding protein n=1 Tax=Mesorhizobium sp. TaxID=1871066 RepID=UPI0011F80471|nr:nucleotide-binding protein [Mesorhizobium sp.]TIL65363.1 MAG: hypothetical protein E5Y77_22420 [Mesorhizobium sp.]
MKPRMFIASSVDHLDLAYAAQEGLEHDVEPTVWTQGVFSLSRSSMASLIDQLDESDFGLFIFSPSDVTDIKDEKKKTVRDNVIFELGLFVGRLGSDRCFLVVPRGLDDLHFPTDLLGLTPAMFDADRQDGNMVAALGPACNRVRKSVQKLGRVTSGGAMPLAATPPSLMPNPSDEVLCSDPNDCITLIQSWMGHRASSENQRAIRYDQVDKTLKLEPGSARKHIEVAAAHYNYVATRKGADTILFEEGKRKRSRDF